ncbi:hypothetical protein ACVWWR_007203 [Bradyrhizobium sp. LM3.2]
MLLVPALADIRAARFLAHRMQAVGAHDVAGVGIATGIGRAHADPIRLRRRSGIGSVHLFGVTRAQRVRDGIDNNDHGVSGLFRSYLVGLAGHRNPARPASGNMADMGIILLCSQAILTSNGSNLKSLYTSARQAAEARLLRPQRPRGRARPDRCDHAGRRRRRDHHRGRGLSSYRASGAFLQRTDAAEPGDVRPARFCLCLPLLRHPLVRELRLRGRRLGRCRADPRAGAHARLGDDAPPPPCGRCARAVLGPGQADRSARHHHRAQRPAAGPSPDRVACADGGFGGGGRNPDRHHQGRRAALALWRQGIDVSEQDRSRNRATRPASAAPAPPAAWPCERARPHASRALPPRLPRPRWRRTSRWPAWTRRA